MGLFPAARRADELQVIEDTSAMRYVKDVMRAMLTTGQNEVVIVDQDGQAVCRCTTIVAPFVEVRNRLGVMAEGIHLHCRTTDQVGRFQVNMEGIAAVFEITIPSAGQRLVLTRFRDSGAAT